MIRIHQESHHCDALAGKIKEDTLNKQPQILYQMQRMQYKKK
jgi:hypothetical protein